MLIDSGIRASLLFDPYINGRREVAFRYDLIRDGVKYDELKAIDTPTVSMTYNAEIKLAFSGTFVHNPRAQYLTDLIKPMMRIRRTWYPLGEYVIGTVKEQHGNGAPRVQIEAYDRSLYLKQATSSHRIMFAKGNRYLDVIQSILLENGIQRVVIPESVKDTLQTDREDWEIGTPYLTIVNKLLSEINFSSLWFDFDGNACLTKYVPPNKAEVTHAYSDDEFSILNPKYERVEDIYTAYNVFVKVVNSPDYPFPLVARAVNDDPQSPISTVSRGREITDPDIQIDNIASQEALQEYVDNLMERSKLTTTTISWATANMPGHYIRDIVSLKNETFSGLVAETRWVMNLNYQGEMTHEGRVITFD